MRLPAVMVVRVVPVNTTSQLSQCSSQTGTQAQSKTTATATATVTKIDSLQKLNSSATTFETKKTEADRLATIQTARDLIHELQTPQESMVDITYSVRTRAE